MWSAILPVILPGVVSVIGYAFKQKLLSDTQEKAFLDFVQAMSQGGNYSKQAHDKFKVLHEQLAKGI